MASELSDSERINQLQTLGAPNSNPLFKIADMMTGGILGNITGDAPKRFQQQRQLEEAIKAQAVTSAALRTRNEAVINAARDVGIEPAYDPNTGNLNEAVTMGMVNNKKLDLAAKQAEAETTARANAARLAARNEAIEGAGYDSNNLQFGAPRQAAPSMPSAESLRFPAPGNQPAPAAASSLFSPTGALQPMTQPAGAPMVPPAAMAAPTAMAPQAPMANADLLQGATNRAQLAYRIKQQQADEITDREIRKSKAEAENRQAEIAKQRVFEASRTDQKRYESIFGEPPVLGEDGQMTPEARLKLASETKKQATNVKAGLAADGSVIPGSKMDVEQKAKASAAAKSIDDGITLTDASLLHADQALASMDNSMLSDSLVAGTGGQFIKNIPFIGQSATDFSNAVKSMAASQGLQWLKTMKNDSGTTGLGRIMQTEFTAAERAYGNLHENDSPQRVRENIEYFKQNASRINAAFKLMKNGVAPQDAADQAREMYPSRKLNESLLAPRANGGAASNPAPSAGPKAYSTPAEANIAGTAGKLQEGETFYIAGKKAVWHN